jgi:hypothetical protein
VGNEISAHLAAACADEQAGEQKSAMLKMEAGDL